MENQSNNKQLITTQAFLFFFSVCKKNHKGDKTLQESPANADKPARRIA